MHTKHTLISEKLRTFLAISGRLENEFSMMTANKSEHSDCDAAWIAIAPPSDRPYTTTFIGSRSLRDLIYRTADKPSLYNPETT